MSSWKTQTSVASIVLGLACIAAPDVSEAAAPLKVPGTITGVVANTTGVPQMGASVLLYNRQDRVFEKAFTNERGEFQFSGLFPDTYSIRVTLATFMPAFKRDILVQPGMRSVLNVNLNSLFSTIRISYPTVDGATLMTDDWKWALRSASATRPVLRFLDPQIGQVSASASRAVFSDTRGVLRVSAGEGPLASSVGNQADLGTAFAVATSLYGNNLLQVSGNLGYGSQTGVPAAAFRTSYSRAMPGGFSSAPEVSITMRQLFLPARIMGAMAGGDASVPMLRTMSAGFEDSLQLSDNVQLQYGATMDSVSFVDHLNYFSPYAKVTYDMGKGAQLDFAYTSGNARPELGAEPSRDSDLQRGLNDLGMFPNVSLRGGKPEIQRGEEFELTYLHKVGSRTYYLSAHHESVTNAALSIVAPGGLYTGGDILPDLFSGSSIFNAGDYQSNGYTVAMMQNLGENFSATVMYGSAGALTAADRELVSSSPDELRSMIHAGQKHTATARVTITSPWTGTHMIASYQWISGHRWAMPGNVYSTQALNSTPGLNIYVRQPIPGLSALPWRMEATADLRNLLAQGYLPLNMANGQQILLVETPRSVRGGLSFIF
jgi:hypothetical protein